MSRKIFIFFGPPGSGKGTQAEKLGQRLGLPVISTGEVLRQAVEAGTAVGRQVKSYVDSGQLAPSPLLKKILDQRLKRDDCAAGFILDGYPREQEEVDDLKRWLKADDVVIWVEIKVSDREVLNRLSGRRVCDCGASYHLVYNPPQRAGQCDVCGRRLAMRSDDRPEVIQRRLVTYHQTAALLTAAAAQYKLISLDGQQPIHQVQAALWSAIQQISN